MIILEIIERILKFIAKIIFGILKALAYVIDAFGFTHFSEAIADPSKQTIFEGADELKTVKQEEQGEKSQKWQ